MKDILINAALKQASQTGIHNLSMGPLAKSANIAVGNFYYHYKSKQELLDHVYIFCRQQFGKAIKSPKKEGKLSYKDQFTKIMERVYLHYHSNLDHYTFLRDAEAGGAISNDAFMVGEAEFRRLKEFLQRGIAENYLRTINPDLALQLFNQSIAALINQEIQNGQTAVSADISDAIRFAWRGLKQKNKKQD